MPVSGDERAYDGPPRSDQSTARCLRCGALAQMNAFGGKRLYMIDDQHAINVAVCSACGRGSVAIESGQWADTPHQRRAKWERERAETWWPPGSSASPIDDNAGVPDDALRFWFEAGRCMSVEAYHAAAVMLRNVLAAIANDVGGGEVAEERSLEGKLRVLAKVKPQTEFLLEYMTALKAIGNAGAHPEDWPDVEIGNAETAASLARYLIEVLYEQPTRVSNGMLSRKKSQ